MKIYISGAISNNPNFKEDFEGAEDYLNKEFPNAEIINPALVNSRLPKSTTHEEYMRMSFCMLDMCDSIFMIDGWQKSCGASQEYGYALAKDKIILFERSWDGRKHQYCRSDTQLNKRRIGKLFKYFASGTFREVHRRI